MSDMDESEMDKTEPKNAIRSFRWGIALVFALIWLFANWTRNIGGIKGTINITGFPLVFASSGDLVETNFSLLALIGDIFIGVAILAASITVLPRITGCFFQGNTITR